MTQIITEVKHSESKDAWNVVGTIPGQKYKIARCPYLVFENKIITENNKREAKEHAEFISEAFKSEYAFGKEIPFASFDISKPIVVGNYDLELVRKAFKNLLVAWKINPAPTSSMVTALGEMYQILFPSEKEGYLVQEEIRARVFKECIK